MNQFFFDHPFSIAAAKEPYKEESAWFLLDKWFKKLKIKNFVNRWIIRWFKV